MRKTTAFVMILFASITMLIHAVIPHHHHHHQVCFDKEDCAMTVVPQSQNLPVQSQSHDCNKFPGCCFLSEYIVTTPNQVYRYYNGSHDQDRPSPENAVIVGSVPQETPIPFSQGLPFYRDISSYFFVISSSSGLRAPPAV